MATAREKKNHKVLNKPPTDEHDKIIKDKFDHWFETHAPGVFFLRSPARDSAVKASCSDHIMRPPSKRCSKHATFQEVCSAPP